MKVLLLCHIEEMFSDYFPEGYRYHVVKELVTGEYDKVFALVSGVQEDEPIEEIVAHGYDAIPWSWGYDAEYCYDWECETCGYGAEYVGEEKCPWVVTDNCGHDAAWVPPELRDDACKTWDIHIGGGYHSECLQDLRAVLEYMGLDYTEEPDIIY